MLYTPTASYHRVLSLTGDEAAAARAHARAEKARIRKALRLARVSRQDDIRPTRDDLSVEHRSRMARRRVRNAAMEPDFTPVANQAVGSAFNAAFMARVKQGHTPVDAHNLALRDIARLLPPGRMVRGAPKPSKSDDPSYRKVTVLKKFRTAS